MAKFPTEQELKNLGKHKVVAYATRNAMRAFTFVSWNGFEELAKQVRKAIRYSAEVSSGGNPPVSVNFANAVFDAASDPVAPESGFVADVTTDAAFIAAYAAKAAYSALAANTAIATAEALQTNVSQYGAKEATVMKAAIRDFRELKSLPAGPLNCGPLGPIWSDRIQDGREGESKLYFLYENGSLDPENAEGSSKHCLELEF